MVFLFLEKWKLFKGKLVEKQGQVLCIQIKAG